MEVAPAMSEFNWSEVLSSLDARTSSPDTDEFIDLIIRVTKEFSSPESISALLKALNLAESTFIKQRVAFSLANIAPDNDSSIVDALISCIADNRDDEFLYIQIINALGLLARRNSLANAELSRILLRLNFTDSPYLLIRAAKIIGQLEQVRKTPGFREKLTEWVRSKDLGVQAEVFQQEAILSFADALLANDFDELKEKLNESRLMFLRAKASEEIREDADIYILLLELILAFFDLDINERVDTVAQVQKRNQALLELIKNPYTQSWYGYRSFREQLIMLRILRISDAFTRIMDSISMSEEWTNFDEALVELAAIYVLIADAPKSGLEAECDGFSKIAPQFLLPKLGPLITQIAGRRRFQKVIENYISANGEDETAQALHLIYESVLEKGYDNAPNITDKTRQKLENVAEKSGETVDFFVDSLVDSLKEGNHDTWLKQHHFPVPPLSIDHPDLFGNNPSIDLTVRSLLKKIRTQLQNYPNPQWLRLINVCEEIARIVYQIRDDLPLYTLRAQDNKGNESGKGQTADEGDLQNDLKLRLERIYGRMAEYEITPIAGGRSDLGLKFSECEFPIECKAEYTNIDPQHIHANYISQADTYSGFQVGEAQKSEMQ
jgi:hypothetical protein